MTKPDEDKDANKDETTSEEPSTQSDTGLLEIVGALLQVISEFNCLFLD